MSAEWQPIETAPRNETVLAYQASQGVCVAYTGDGEDWYLIQPWNAHEPADDALMRYPPTHWQPLPEPPPS